MVLVERSTLQTHQFTIMIGNVARQRFQAFYTNQNPERFIRDTLFLSVNSIPVNSLNYEKCLSETLTSDQIVTHNYPSKFAVEREYGFVDPQYTHSRVPVAKIYNLDDLHDCKYISGNPSGANASQSDFGNPSGANQDLTHIYYFSNKCSQ